MFIFRGKGKTNQQQAKVHSSIKRKIFESKNVKHEKNSNKFCSSLLHLFMNQSIWFFLTIRVINIVSLRKSYMIFYYDSQIYHIHYHPDSFRNQCDSTIFCSKHQYDFFSSISMIFSPDFRYIGAVRVFKKKDSTCCLIAFLVTKVQNQGNQSQKQLCNTTLEWEEWIFLIKKCMNSQHFPTERANIQKQFCLGVWTCFWWTHGFFFLLP